MKKQYLTFIALVVSLGSACGCNRDSVKVRQPDSVANKTSTRGMDKKTTDSPALDTDNIRMDSMNNSPRK